MADPLISLDTDRVSAQPGGQARVTVTVTNPGTVVEGYWLQVLGPAAAWAEVVPPEVSVYPQQEATAAVVFSPPAGPDAPGGVQPFGVLASSTLDADASAAAEGELEIGEVFGLEAKIIPVTSSGAWRGRHVVQLSNWGNSIARLQLTVSDPDEALGFYVQPAVVELPPGGRTAVRVTARTRHPFLRGSPVRLPFQVVGEPLDAEPGPQPTGSSYGDPSRPVVDGALNQKPILSKTVITLLTLLLAGIVALVVYLAVRPPTATETLASRGSPPKPQLTVSATGPDTVALSWAPIELVERYNLQHIDPQNNSVTKVDTLDGALTAVTVTGLTPDTVTCFRLSATRGGLTGPLSDQVCPRTGSASPTPSASPTDTAAPSQTASASPSTSPSATPSTTPGDPNTDPLMRQAWITVAAVLPTSSGPDAEAEAKAEADKLSAADLPAGYLDTRFYPRLLLTGLTATATPVPTPPAEQSFLAYAGPFADRAEAESRCPAVTQATGVTECLVAQPDPP